jgi:hypothetical protein
VDRGNYSRTEGFRQLQQQREQEERRVLQSQGATSSGNNHASDSIISNSIRKSSSDERQTRYSFVTECFFMTARILNLGLLRALSDYKGLMHAAVLSATDFCFLVAHEIISEPKLKHSPEVLFLSSALPAQFELVNPCSFTSLFEAYLKPYIIVPRRYLKICFAATHYSCLGSTWNWLNMFTAKHMFGLVFTKYIKEPINCWYRDKSIGSSLSTSSNLLPWELPWICNPSSQISEGSLQRTSLVLGRLHHASATLLVPSSSA